MYSCYIAPENTQSFQISEIVKDGWVIFKIKRLNICFWEAERNERKSVEKPLRVILFGLQIKNQESVFTVHSCRQVLQDIHVLLYHGQSLSFPVREIWTKGQELSKQSQLRHKNRWKNFSCTEVNGLSKSLAFNLNKKHIERRQLIPNNN